MTICFAAPIRPAEAGKVWIGHSTFAGRIGPWGGVYAFCHIGKLIVLSAGMVFEPMIVLSGIVCVSDRSIIECRLTNRAISDWPIGLSAIQ